MLCRRGAVPEQYQDEKRLLAKQSRAGGTLVSVPATAGQGMQLCLEKGSLSLRRASSREERVHLLMVSATAGTSARRTMFSRPRYLMLGSRTLMNFPSSDTPARGHTTWHSTMQQLCNRLKGHGREPAQQQE